MENLNQNKVITFPNTQSIKNRQKFLHKVDGWLGKRYSVAVDFVETYHLTTDIHERITSETHFVQDKKVILPILDSELLIGCLILTPKADFKKSNLTTILELVEGVVGPFIRQIHRSERVRRDEQRLAANMNSMDRDATVSLFHTKSADFTEREIDMESIPPLYIEGPGKETIRREALDAHEEKNVLFFLPFEDIDVDKRNDINELRGLGRTTIFISDLSLYERADLGAVLDLVRTRSRYDSDFPFFIFGSTVEFAQIERRLKLSDFESEVLTANSMYITQ